MKAVIPFVLFMMLIPTLAFAQDDFFTARIDTYDWDDRAAVANSGADIIYVHPTEGWIVADIPNHRDKDISTLDYTVTPIAMKNTFPDGYSEYHDYQEQIEVLQNLHAAYPAVTELFTFGKSHEGRDLWCLKISDNPEQDETDEGAAFIVAMHHAREILSPEVALHVATRLLELYEVDPMITALIENREIFIAPNVNPDGSEYDHSGGSFKLWRKNRSPNDGHNCKGVDLNRNYSYKWGGAGSTNLKCDLTYRGPEAFSEPEARAVRDFVYAHENIRTIATLHTFSELILYPWGYTRQRIEDDLDYHTFDKLAKLMANENGYTPQQASDLYPTTGDTTDWAYGELGIFCFTFELSPDRWSLEMFYPKPDIFQRAFPDNFNALLYLIGIAPDPTRILSAELWKLNAVLDDSTATITWAPFIETEPEGWNVYFSNDEFSNYTKLNGQMILPGKGEYSFDHAWLEPGLTYFYKVEYVSATGKDQLFGPVSVTMPNEDTDDDDDVFDDDDDDVVESTDDDDDSGRSCGW